MRQSGRRFPLLRAFLSPTFLRMFWTAHKRAKAMSPDELFAEIDRLLPEVRASLDKDQRAE